MLYCLLLNFIYAESSFSRNVFLARTEHVFWWVPWYSDAPAGLYLKIAFYWHGSMQELALARCLNENMFKKQSKTKHLKSCLIFYLLSYNLVHCLPCKARFLIKCLDSDSALVQSEILILKVHFFKALEQKQWKKKYPDSRRGKDRKSWFRGLCCPTPRHANSASGKIPPLLDLHRLSIQICLNIHLGSTLGNCFFKLIKRGRPLSKDC